MSNAVTIPIEIIDRFTAPVRSYQQSMGRIQAATDATGKELKALNTTASQLSSYEKLQNRLVGMQRRLQTAADKVVGLKAEMEAAKVPSKQLVEQLDGSELSLKQVSLAETELKNKLQLAKIEVERKSRALEKLEAKTNAGIPKNNAQAAAIKKAEIALSQANTAYEKHTLKLTETEKKSQKAKTKIVALKQAIEQSTKPTDALVRRFEKAKAELEKMEKAASDQSTELEQLGNKLGEAGLDVKRLGEAQEQTGEKIKRTTRLMEQQEKAQKNLARAQSRRDDLRSKRSEMLGQGATIAATAFALSRPLKHAISAEDAFADVIKFAKFDTDSKTGKLSKKGREDADKMQQTILEKSIETGLGFANTAALYSVALQNNQRGADTGKFVRNAADMAIAFDIEANKAANTLSAWRNSMKLSADEALDLAKATNHLSDATAGVNARDVAEVVAFGGAGAKSAGFTPVQSAAFASALLSTGKTPEIARTAMKNISLTLAKGDRATDKEKRAFRDLGLDAGQISKEMQANAPATMIKLFQRIQSVRAQRPDEVSGIIGELFGTQVVDSVMPLADNLENLEKAFANVADRTLFENSLRDEVALRTDTRAHQLKQLNSAYEAMQTNIGNALLPTLAAFITPMARWSQSFAKFAKENEVLTQSLFTAAAGFTAAMTAALGIRLVSNLYQSMGNSVAIATGKLNVSKSTTSKVALLASQAIDTLNRSLGRTAGTSAAGSLASGAQTIESQKKGSNLRRLGKGAAITSLVAATAGAAYYFLRDDEATKKDNSEKATAVSNDSTKLAISDSMEPTSSPSFNTTALAAGLLAPLAPAALSMAAQYAPIAAQKYTNFMVPEMLEGSGGKARMAGTAALRATPLAFVAGAVGIGHAALTGDGEDVSGAVGSTLSSAGTIAAGAAIGTMLFPGIGTAVGAAVGGVASLWTSDIGETIGRSIWRFFVDDDEDEKQQNQKNTKELESAIKEKDKQTTAQTNRNNVSYSPQRTYHISIDENTTQAQIDEMITKLKAMEEQQEQKEKESLEKITANLDRFQLNSL